MPNQPKTPQRSFRIAKAVYDPAAEKVKEDGANLTALVNEAFLQYVSGEWKPWSDVPHRPGEARS